MFSPKFLAFSPYYDVICTLTNIIKKRTTGNMKQQKTMIFFGAHPDDETFGMGSTLAQYVTAGVKVYYVCSTRGEAGTVDPEYMNGYATIEDLRSAEMRCAAQVLGLAGVIYLGYRDSGMQGAADNKNSA